MSQFGLSPYDAGVLTASRELAGYYEDVVTHMQAAGQPNPKLAANWVMGELSAAMNAQNVDAASVQGRVSSLQFAGLLLEIVAGVISGSTAKEVFNAMWNEGADVKDFIEKHGLRQISDPVQLETFIDAVMAKSPGQLADYRAGKDKLFGYFVGQVMKATGGKANPAQLNELLKRKLAG